MLRTLLLIVLIPVASLLAWLALRTPAQRADFVVASDVLRTVDPQRVSWLDEIQVANALFEGLTRLHPETLLPEPGVAARWDASPDHLQYTFHLRPTARWSSGDPVTADDFRRSWLNVLDPSTEAQYAGLLFVIAGAAAHYRSRLNDDPADDTPAEAVGVTALDAHTLRVTLAGPCSYFLDLTAFPTLAPVPPVATSAPTARLWTRSEPLVGNGAFILTRWEFKQHLRLMRNPHYWDRDSVALDSIEIYLCGDPNAALIAYETGRVDLVRGLPAEVARALAAEQAAGRRPDFHVGDRFATFFFRVNCRRPPLDNPALRQALALAIDKPALCANVLGLGETPADSYVPRGALQLMPRADAAGRTVYYEPPAGLGAGRTYAERVALAREYLAASGFAPNSRAIELTYAGDPPLQGRIAEAVQQMWQQALGLRVTLRALDRKALSSAVRDLNYDVVRSDWFGDYLDPATFLDMFTTENGQNRTGWSNTEYDRLIAAAAAEPDNVRRFALFRDAERILCEDELPIIPLFFRLGNYLLNPRFGGVRDNVRDILPLHRVRRMP